MYCPVCGAEYRPGFSVCSDCQVALVPDPPASAAKATADRASYATLWAGDDPLKHAEIREALDDRKIPSRTLHREDRSFNVVTQPAFEVFVPAAAFDSARAAIKDILAGEEDAEASPDAGELQSQGDDADEDDRREAEQEEDEEERRSTLGLDPLDATVQIWSGKDRDMAAMIVSSLRENQILCRSNPEVSQSIDDLPGADKSEDESPQINKSTGNKSTAAAGEARPIRLFVLPQDERRAKTILREILEATPPE